MLVLTRTVGEALIVGDGIEVVVLSIHGGKVRIGIKAPSDVPVHRTEVYLAIQAQGKMDAGSEPQESPAVRGR